MSKFKDVFRLLHLNPRTISGAFLFVLQIQCGLTSMSGAAETEAVPSFLAHIGGRTSVQLQLSDTKFYQNVRSNVEWLVFENVSTNRGGCGINCSIDTWTFRVLPNNSGRKKTGQILFDTRACSLPNICPWVPQQESVTIAGRGVMTSAASFRTDFAAPNGLATIFGEELGTETAHGVARPLWPTNLGGLRMNLFDNGFLGIPLGMSFASREQVNFHLPANLTSGPHLFLIESQNGNIVTVLGQVQPKAPDLFRIEYKVGSQTIFHSALYIVRVESEGNQTIEQLMFNPDGQVKPIEVDRPDESVYLVFYGTGIRNEPYAANNLVVLDGLRLRAEYAGPANGFPGVDQVNLRLQSGLSGRGLVNLQFFSGLEEIGSNSVQVNFK